MVHSVLAGLRLPRLCASTWWGLGLVARTDAMSAFRPGVNDNRRYDAAENDAG
jgi:hypothetical protein